MPKKNKTRKDLLIQFNRETGHQAQVNAMVSDRVKYTQDYAVWLEEKLMEEQHDE